MSIEDSRSVSGLETVLRSSYWRDGADLRTKADPKMGEEKNTKQCEEKVNLNANARIVPDGGWGWIISCAAFTVQFIILGLQNHLGLIHREHLEHFGKSNVDTGTSIFHLNYILLCSPALNRRRIVHTQIYFVISNLRSDFNVKEYYETYIFAIRIDIHPVSIDPLLHRNECLRLLHNRSFSLSRFKIIWSDNVNTSGDSPTAAV